MNENLAIYKFEEQTVRTIPYLDFYAFCLGDCLKATHSNTTITSAIKRRQKAKGRRQKVFTVRMGIFTPPEPIHRIDGGELNPFGGRRKKFPFCPLRECPLPLSALPVQIYRLLDLLW